MDAYSLHLAMAALFGASFVAVSAYYMHRKTLNQLLEFAKAVERDRHDVAAAEDGADAVDHLRHYNSRRRRKSNGGYYRRGSASLPDVTTFSGGGEAEEKRNGPLHVDTIPPGLPRLHTLPQGKSGNVNAATRAGNLRPTSPKSPVASASAFESLEGSDDEDNMTDSSKLDATYLQTNGNADVPDHINATGETIPMAASSMIRSHSASGDLHGVQPDPVAADILRKEPEQETFVRLRISPTGILLIALFDLYSWLGPRHAPECT